LASSTHGSDSRRRSTAAVSNHRTLVVRESPDNRCTSPAVRCTFPWTRSDRRSNTGELVIHQPAPTMITNPSDSTAHLAPPFRAGRASEGSSVRTATWLEGCEVEIADTLHLRLQVHSETLFHRFLDRPDKAVHLPRGRPRTSDDEVGVLVGNRSAAHRQPLRSRRLHQASGVV